MVLLGFFRVSDPTVDFAMHPVIFGNVSFPTNGSTNTIGIWQFERPAFTVAIYEK
jgi:hypothetical protein